MDEGNAGRAVERIGIRAAVVAALIAFPFVFPLAAGPSRNVWQLLASWACIALLLLFGPSGRAAPRIHGLLGLAALAIVVDRGSDLGLWLPACIALGAMALAANTAAGLGRRLPTSLALGLLGAGLLSAVLGLLQYFGLAASVLPWAIPAELGQAYGSLRQRNQFASLISMALVAALWLHAAHGHRWRGVLSPAAVLLLFAAAASTSRTGLLQLMLIAGVATFLARRERRPAAAGAGAVASNYRLPSPSFLAACVAAYFAAAWLLPLLAGPDVVGMAARLRHGPDTTGRLILWRNVLDLIAVHPWAGWGWGELKFAHYQTLYAGPRFSEILDNAHNLPLHLAVELGIPAALAICGAFCWLVIAAKPWRDTEPARLMAWGVLGVIVIHSLLEYPLWYGPFQLVFGLCLGSLWPAAPPGPQTAAAKSWLAGPVPSVSMSLALMAAVVYTAWDYTRISQIFLAREERLPPWRDDTLAKLQASRIFASQVAFAGLTLTPLTRANAAVEHERAQRVLHFSAEPRVIVKLIDSAMMLGLDDEVFAQARRFKVAFPKEYALWLQGRPLDSPAD